LCAYVPQPGRALIERGADAFGPGFAEHLARDELKRSWWPDPAAAACDLQHPPESTALAARLRRQARKPIIEPSPVAAMRTNASAYIVCTDDYAIPPAWQRRVAQEELVVTPIELQSGHSPMLTCPLELMEIFERLAASRLAMTV
jgi:hypothetical protein